MAQSLRIVFMGTPHFAIPSLAALYESRHEVAVVVTAPDKPAGRGRQLSQSPVKEFAVQHRIPILQPEKLKDPDFLEALRNYNADLFIVVAFRMLPEAVWQMPPMGTFNLHASLLPSYRGAAPINWAIINGEKETGLTTFFLKHAIDTGDILLQEKVEIGEDVTAGELHDRLALLGAQLVVKTVDGIAADTLHPVPQPESTLTHAPKLSRENTRINWESSLDSLHNLIRGLSPVPSAWTTLDDKNFKVYQSQKEEADHLHAVPTLISDFEDEFKVAVNGGYLHLQEVQLEGKRRMRGAEFAKGYKGDLKLV